MIISPSHNFIFLHSRKTAGSSVSAALNKYLGSQDIQIGAWPDAIAAGGRINSATRKIVLSSLRATLVPTIKHSLQTGRFAIPPQAVNQAVRQHYRKRGLVGGAHSLAKDVQRFDPELWAKAFKFCFVRNPWSHAVSDYHWRCSQKKCNTVGFTEFLYRLQDPLRPDPEDLRPPIVSNWQIYTIDDKIAVDHVARYENIDQELAYIGKKIGLDINIRNIHAKGGIRKKQRPIESYYDDEAIELVRELYRAEIEAFNYQPFQ